MARESSKMPEETPDRPHDRLPSQSAAKKSRIWLRIAAVVLAIAALFDWMRPPSRQVSVVLYNNVVIKGYRLLLQPWGKYIVRCPFRPTCSVYSEQAMENHGFPRGVWMTTSRLFRCMPWVKFGTEDSVPKTRMDGGG